MKTPNQHSKRGGITVFLCIILSAVILTESILFCAARERGIEAELTKCMHLQTAQILCNYNEALLENYGLYAMNSNAVNQDVFATCFQESSDASVTVDAENDMTKVQLQTGIVDFMKLRIPAIAGNEILSRLKSVLSEIGDNDIVKQSKQADTSAWLGTLKDYLAGKETWSTILSNVASFVSVVDFTGKLSDLEAFAAKYRTLTEQKTTRYLQGDADTDFGNSILQPETLSDMMTYADNLLDYDFPDFADTLLINQYALSFFDSKLAHVVDGDSENAENNILGTPYSEIHKGNHADLEYLLTGIEDETVSAASVAILILDIRTILNFGAFLLDKTKVEEARGIADVVCVAIAIISAGSLTVDPAVVTYAVLFVMALIQGLADAKQLMNGESVTFFLHPTITDQPVLEELLMTDYRDYVGFFLLFVPVEWKTSRILTVLKRDCGKYLYTGVRISVTYRDNLFEMEDSYDAYA